MKMTTRTRPSTRCWTMSFDVAGRERGHDERQDEEQPDPEDGGDPEHERDAALADLDALVLGLEARAADEPLGAHHEGLVEHDEPAHERPLGRGLAAEAALELFGGVDDAAVGVTEGDGDGIAAAHHDALDERLAAIGEAGHARSLPGGSLEAPSAMVLGGRWPR